MSTSERIEILETTLEMLYKNLEVLKTVSYDQISVEGISMLLSSIEKCTNLLKIENSKH